MVSGEHPAERLEKYGFTSERRSFEALLVPFSIRCLNAPLELLDTEIERGLQEIISFFDCDQALLWESADDGQRLYLCHSTLNSGKAPPLSALLHEFLPFISNKILGQKTISVSRLQDLPHGAHLDKQYLKQCGVRSYILVPLIVGGILRGALNLVWVRTERLWSDANWFNIERICSVIAGALDRRRSHTLLEQRLQFETLITDLSARLIKTPASDVDEEIKRSLTEVRTFFQGDRCTLLGLRDNNKVCWVSHASYAEGLDHLSGDINLADLFPWSYDWLVIQGKHLNVSSFAELPHEAEVEFDSWNALGIRSALSVPILLEGRVASILVINAINEEFSWSEDYVSRLRLLGEICTGALRRRDYEATLHDSEVLLQAQLKEIKQLKKKIESENLYLRNETSMLSEHGDIIAESRMMKSILAQVEQVAQSDSTVLVAGETGTGKELVARQIHKLSSRKDRPMIMVNCASLQPTLIESELFGREKGAYTGAMTKMAGRFEVADGSTLFLDEIAELALDLQSKLLRVIEEGTFERLGSTRTIQVNVRIIAATNRDLWQEVQKGTFRQDLFYRLNVFPLTIPPLRERVQDIAPLVWTFVRHFEKKMGKQIENIPKRNMESLQHYSWPGNVRELRNVIEYAMIVTRSRTLMFSIPVGPGIETSEKYTLDLKSAERQHILRILKKYGWRISGPDGAAAALQLKRTTLQSKMKKLGIKRPSS